MKTYKTITKQLLNVAKKSKDPRTKVGCIIKDQYGEYVSKGFNGFPAGCIESDEMWTPENKYTYVIHAEANAILYAEGYNLTDCILYCTLEPCHECAKLIAASGISKVYYLESRYDNKTDKLIRSCKIKWIKME